MIIKPAHYDRGAAWELMRAVLDRGGTIRACESHYDHDAEGRVITLVAFYPGNSGYSRGLETKSDDSR